MTHSNRAGPRIASPGHAAFAATMIGLGVLGLVTGRFPSVWAPLPKAVPAQGVAAYVTAVVSLACGLGLLWPRTAGTAARVLFAFLAAWLVLLRVPHMILAWGVGTWWSAGKMAVMTAAAWVSFVWFAGGSGASGSRLAGERALRAAQALYGLALIPFGLAHFLYLKETTVLIPAWLPWPDGWAWFTGAAFIAAGLAMIAGVWGRLAAVLSVVEVGTFTLVVWVPVVMTGPNAYQWQEFVTSVAITGAGWMVADSFGRGPTSLRPDRNHAARPVVQDGGRVAQRD